MSRHLTSHNRGWNEGDQCWKLARIGVLITRTWHANYTPSGVSKMLRRHGPSAQVCPALGPVPSCLSRRTRNFPPTPSAVHHERRQEAGKGVPRGPGRT
ncbi:winged helix-turn-helix domain-containing protein [Micromonospora sp. ALFpr18c]|uniref:helix-turn-helix domain-containing protein n=1 Tax=Micromonospora sp. NPDC050695 TaxID=3154938 RepID=UPI001CED8CDD